MDECPLSAAVDVEDGNRGKRHHVVQLGQPGTAPELPVIVCSEEDARREPSVIPRYEEFTDIDIDLHESCAIEQRNGREMERRGKTMVEGITLLTALDGQKDGLWKSEVL